VRAAGARLPAGRAVPCPGRKHGKSSRLEAQATLICGLVAQQLVSLPPCSSNFNPMEKALAKLEALLRSASERAVVGLWRRAFGGLIDAYTPSESANYFAADGHGAD